MSAPYNIYKTMLSPVRASTVGAQRINNGGRVLLPPSCLSDISNLAMVFPLQFKITVHHSKKVVFAAVLEFTAERGTVVLPDWMADYLNVSTKASLLHLETCNLQEAHYVKLQPHTQNFTALEDPRAVLERHLTNYPVLTKGTSIEIHYVSRVFQLRIVDLVDVNKRSVEAVLSARADSQATEVQVEFERPMDMPEEDEVDDIPFAAVQSTPAGPSGDSSDITFNPSHQFLPPTLEPTKAPSFDKKEEKAPSFVPFSGDGKPLCDTNSSTTAGLTPEQIRQARLARLARR